MTTAAPTSIPQVTPSTNSSAPSAHSRTASVSGQASSSAAVPASAPTRSYAIAAAPKKLNTPAIVASNVNQVAGGTSGQHARHTSTASTPVNGSRVVPAVPAILNSGNAIANGANKAFSGGSHSRKSSQSVPGAPMMPNGAPRPPNVSFGGFNEACNPSGTQSGPAVAATNSSLTAPMAPNPRVNSPQPAPVVSQASGGLPQTSAPGAIQFGDATHQQQSRPVSMPPTGPNSHGQGHSRRDSTQSAHADTTPAHVGHSARAMPSGNRGGRAYNNQNQYNQNQQYNNNTYARGYANNSNQQRGGPPAMGIPNYQASGHMPSYQSSPRNQHRSPHLAHASPSMASAQMAPTQLFPPQYMTNQPHYQMPYDPNYYPQPFYQLPQYGVMQTSPRPAYTQIAQTVQGSYIPQQYGTSMSRSPSANISDLHVRPNSSMGQLPAPSLAPQSVAVPPQPPGTPGPQSPYSSRKPAGKGIDIKNPVTGAKVEFKSSSKPPTSNTPVIVSSPSPAPGNRAPSRDANHSRDASKSGKSEQEKRDEMKATVAKKVLDDAKKEAEERKQKEEELAEKAEEERMKREKEASEELKRKEEEAMKLQKEAEEKARQEAEEKAKKEEEERKRKEEEEAAEAARLAKEKADEEQARIAKEKAEEEARIQAENEKKAQEEEEAIKLKAEEDAKIAAEAKAEEEKAASLLAPVSKPSTPDSESMPPPPLKGAEKRSKPSPLNLQIKTNEPAPPSAALTALRSARFIENLNGVNYPSNILSPNPALNPAASGKFKYEKDFLMQFQSVFTEKPSVDWDQKMKDTVGDTDSARPSTARTPSGLGPRGSNRGGLPQSNNPPMGAFGSAFKPLGPQMQTSAQRFEQSQRAQTTPGNALPGLAGSNFSRQGGLIRTASSTSLSSSNAAPQSPRIQNRSARGSKRGGAGTPMERSDSRQAERSQPTIPLGDVKPLPVSENRWKPRSVGAVKAVEAPAIIPTPSEDNRLSPELVQRKVKSNLNKMTPEKFDKISDQILEITSQSKFETDGRTLRQVIQLTFEKATDEAAWSSMYAKFCKRMLETMDPSIKDENIRDKNDNIVTGGNLFRKYLLNRCQEEFERGWKVQAGKEDVILSDEYYINAAAKRRGLGLVQFIGELFKLGMLTERIMNECVRKLLDFEGVPEDETVESLVKLLKTIGGQLDGSTKSKSMMDMYFARINSMTEHKELNSRMKFMLMDIVDLRRKGWATKEADKGPKTMQEVRDEAMKAQQEKEAISRANQRSGRSGGGRGDGRSFSNNFGGGGGGMQPPGGYHDNKGGLVDTADLKKLGAGARSKMSSQGPSTFGPSSMFTRNASSGGSRRGFGSTRGDDSGPSSRTATPPAPATTSHVNPYSLLGGDSGDANDTASPPPSTASSPPVTNAKLDRARTPQPSQD